MPHSRHRCWTGLVLATAMGLAACRGGGGGGGGGATTAPPTSAPPATDVAKAAKAKAAVFQASDFPTGFSIVDEVDSGLDLEIVWGDITRCLGVDKAAPDEGSATSPTYLRGLATQAQSTVEYTSAPGAAAVVTGLTGPKFSDCAHQAFVADLKRNAPEGAVPGAVQVAPRDYPQKGQRTLAWRIDATVNLDELRVPLSQDFIVVVDDGALVRLLFLNPGSEFPQELEQSLVDKVVSRA